MITNHLALALPFLLVACSSQEPGTSEQTADTLDNAASQSSPGAAAALHEEADRVRDTGRVLGADDTPNGTVQNAMQNASEVAEGNRL